MKDLIGQAEQAFAQYKLLLNVLFTLTTTDEARRSLYDSLVAIEEYVSAISDKRIQELYSRVIEDCRASVSRAILDSDYRAFYGAIFKKANDVEARVDQAITALKQTVK